MFMFMEEQVHEWNTRKAKVVNLNYVTFCLRPKAESIYGLYTHVSIIIDIWISSVVILDAS